VSVLISRPANLPPDPPEPARPVTAPAGKPIACAGAATVVNDPAGDILSYEPGSPPAQVTNVTRELSRIDITRAAVQIDGRTICATFVFAQPSGDIDFGLTLSLRDVSSPCCASLVFASTAGQLEVGYLANVNGVTELKPVRQAGAELRGKMLIITGTLPPPSAWWYGSHRMPTAENIGWSLTTRYVPKTYGPSFSDWVPRDESVNEPLVRHRDGATVRPGARR
jgi:hypothetical protein